MITGLYLKNYRCFKEVDINFMKTSKRTKSAVFIFGENGIGKSSLISSISFLNELIYLYRYKSFFSAENLNNIFEKSSNIPKEFLESKIKKLLERNKKINSTGENMVINIDFIINNKKGSYNVEFDEDSIVYEELKYEKKYNYVTVYKLGKDKANDWIDYDYIFLNDKYKEEIDYYYNSNRGQCTFLSVIFESIMTRNREFIDESLCLEIKDIANTFAHMNYIGNDHQLIGNNIMNLRREKIITGSFRMDDIKFKERLQSLTKQLTYFYSSFNKRIKNVEYLFKNENNNIKYKLVFNEYKNNEYITIPFNYISDGSKKLLSIFLAIKALIRGETVIVDEIDTSIHDVAMNKIIMQLISENEMFGQLIATTHNLSIMEKLNAHQVYLLDDCISQINITALSKNANIQANHNIAKLYLKGLLSTINEPTFDIHEFKDIIENSLK